MSSKADLLLEPFGSLVPFAEPPDLQGQRSPHYTAAHRAWRERCRDFVDRELVSHVDEWEEQADLPVEELRQKAYAAGIFGAMWPAEYGGTPPESSEGAWCGSWAGSRVDPFFELILWDEVSRCASGGVVAGLFGGLNIGLPPVLLHGSQDLKERVAREAIAGRKSFSLAITEPGAGSDVANIRTSAVRDEEGCWVVTGAKKWITGGLKADYFTTLCCTGSGATRGGMSLLLIERDMPGVTLTRMQTQGWLPSQTTFVELDSVRVPASNVIGNIGEGFQYTMVNFTRERFVMAAQMVRSSRICVEDAVSFARRRQTFGRRLIDHQVIRHKIADMARRIEGSHRMLENYCYQVKCGSPHEELAGYMALTKVDCSLLMEFCAREASQIFGGQSFTRSGAGARVERIYRDVRVMAIGGGSEEIMKNLAMSQAKL